MKFGKSLLAAGCVCAVLTSGMAAQAASGVRVSSPDVRQVYVEGVPAAFPSADAKQLYQPILYMDATYIPLRTVGLWMGKDVAWDEKTETATLSGTKDREFPSNRDPKYRQVGQTLLSDSGSAALRPEFHVVLDGKTLNFTNARGETIYPLVFEDAIYLPLRNIGELTGYQVTWAPSSKKGDNRIFLNTPVNEAQKAEMKQYVSTLTEALKKFWKMADELGNNGFTDVQEPGTKDQTATRLTNTELANRLLPQMKTVAQEVRNMPEPPNPILNYYYGRVTDKMDYVFKNIDPLLERIQKGEQPCIASSAGEQDEDPVTKAILFDNEFVYDVRNMMECATLTQAELPYSS